jgi:hypothetical protein
MIVLEFSIGNVDLWLAGKTPAYPEEDPLFHVYTSADLGIMKDSRRLNAPPLEQGVVIPGPFTTKRYTLVLPEATHLRATSSLVISLYAHSNEQGQDYLVPCGSASLNLDQRLRTVSLPAAYNLELVDPHPKSPVSKGTFDITIHGATWDIQKDIETENWMVNERRWMDDMNNYVLRVMRMFLSEEDDLYYGVGKPLYPKAMKYRPSHPKLKQIHCPFYQMELPGKKLPGFAYSWIMPRTPPNEEYFVKLIRGGLELYEMAEKDFLAAIEKQGNSQTDKIFVDYKMAVDIVGGICSLYAQGKLYVPDHVNTYKPGDGKFDATKFIQDVENMNNLRVTRGNDCEDAGDDNRITTLTLKNYDGWTHPLTRACQRVLKQFLVLLPHGAVATASAAESTNGSQAPNDASFIAHIFCLLLPYGRLSRMLERTGTDPSLLGIPSGLPVWNIDLDVVFCEGTGRVSPILKPQWEWQNHEKDWYIQTARTQVDFEKANTSFSSYNILQAPLIAHPKNTYNYNTFYRYVVASFVPAGQGARVGDITFIYAKEESYGVLVHDLVYDINEPGIVINEVLTDDQRKFIQNCLCVAHPVPQLYPRNSDLIKQDIDFLELTLGIPRWSPDKQNKHFGYFFTVDELRKSPKKIKFDGPFECTYKYFGLDDSTAYIELCLYQK